MSQKPNTPKGTRDFLPETVIKRNYLTGIIKSHFEKFGFLPIETPSFEKSSTLLGKYGEEGDRLVFKILNSGDKVKKADVAALQNNELAKFSNSLSEKALRYDLTVPFARFVVQHQNELTFPFKRYQIQQVWRADRPQFGRFQEFYQCDADVVGVDSLWQEVECIQLYDAVFSNLGLSGVTVHMNHRKILAGIAEIIGAETRLIDFTVALDKIDKIGSEAVEKELLSKGFDQSAIEKLRPLFSISGTVDEVLNQLETILQNSAIGLQGISDVRFIAKVFETQPLQSVSLAINVTLARGLDYYTGTIFEVSAPKEVEIGSIGGGGRYDDLTSVFGLSNMSGIGISFGLDRIYLVLEQLNLFPSSIESSIDVLVLNFGESTTFEILPLINLLRDQGMRVSLYPNAAKIKKQFSYADKNNVQFVLMYGEEESLRKEVVIKNMKTGNQQIIAFKNVEKSCFKH
ncbi:MAG: histidine--tRNA ligase [Flavobacteriaceae bacterium]|nr:histidine--tRNA ligase [Flavobacteriaceae bacterium]MDG2314831.1 histidine--tRNA ligase [Flavobacteriaceae bacterium]